ncbi:MAG TPA: glycosyltransferase family 4 protein [Longimicrobiaceae bacterium]|nr:glycosyltransferase family 4 protein [Longimicrobiaceae bacterium]
MNVLLVAPAYFPAIGGGETHVRVLAEGLAARGHEVAVLTDRLRPDWPERECLNGVAVLRTCRYRAFLDRADRVPWEECVFGLLREFSELLAGRRVEVVHAHCQVSAVLGAMMKGSLGCPLVVSLHETEPERDPMGEGKSRLVCGHLPYDLLVAGSRFFFRQALRYGTPPERVRLIHYGVDVSRFAPGVPGGRVRAALGVGERQPLVLLVGRFKERKGILEFIRAMSRVAAEVPDVRALVNGSCHSASLDYLAAVRREIEARGLGEVVILREAAWTQEEMPEVYAAADLVVQPSHVEGFGLAVLEAMAVERPVVGTRTRGIEEIVEHGGNGWLVPVRDAEALAGAILDLLRDRDRAAELARRGREFVERHLSAESMVASTLAAYREILASARAEPRPPVTAGI